MAPQEMSSDLFGELLTLPHAVPVKLSPLHLLAWANAPDGRRLFIHGRWPHRNPELFKRYWWIKVSADEAFDLPPSSKSVHDLGFCTADCLSYLHYLSGRRVKAMYGNTSLPREGPNTPFTQAKSDRWAPALDHDSDPWCFQDK